MLQPYRALVREVDRIGRTLKDFYGENLVCSRGCNSCCRHQLSVFEVEAAAVGAAVGELPSDIKERLMHQAQESSTGALECPMLLNGSCTIYRDRPIICRTQGLPLLITTDNGRQEVDFCSLNFTFPGATDLLDETHMLPLEAVNTRFALANLIYCSRIGLDWEAAGQRRSLAAVILARLA